MWKYLADIIKNAGASELTAYALILLLGAGLLFTTLKRVNPLAGLAAGFPWFLVATAMLAWVVSPPKPRPEPTPDPTPPSLAALLKLPGEEAVAGTRLRLDLGAVANDIPRIVDLSIRTNSHTSSEMRLVSVDLNVSAEWTLSEIHADVNDANPASFGIALVPQHGDWSAPV